MLEEFFIFMERIKLKICLNECNIATHNPDLKYFAEAIEYCGRYFYRVNNVTIEITKLEYEQVIKNPSLSYFTTALKLHTRIEQIYGLQEI